MGYFCVAVAVLPLNSDSDDSNHSVFTKRVALVVAISNIIKLIYMKYVFVAIWKVFGGSLGF